MSTSDDIALLALVVSLVSFWLSYRSIMESKRVSVAEKISGARFQMLEVLLKTDDMLLSAKAALARNDRDTTQQERLNLLIDVLETRKEQSRQAMENLSNAKESDPTKLEKDLRIVSDISALSNSLVERFEKLEANGLLLAEPPPMPEIKPSTVVRHV